MFKIITWGVVFYLAYCGMLFFFQRWVLFPRGQVVSMPGTAERVPGLEKIFLETKFGSVESWFLPPLSEKNPSPVLIFAHGNAELIDHWPEVLYPLTRHGIGVYLVEYPGYGRSEGEPSQETITAAFLQAHDRIIQRKDVDADHVVFVGRSIGGGAICALADKRPPAAMILMSTFTSVRTMAKKFGAPPFLVRDPFDNLKVVRSYGEPLLVMHGKHDDVIPYSHGRKLSRASRQARLITYDCAHNDCPPSWSIFYNDLINFLVSNGILKNKSDRFAE